VIPPKLVDFGCAPIGGEQNFRSQSVYFIMFPDLWQTARGCAI